MARKASGADKLEFARVELTKAKTASELRQAQAVILPLEFGFSLEQTAQIIGVSMGWVSQLRNQFIREGAMREANRPKRGGRRQANLSPDEEKEFLAPFFAKAKTGGILVVSEIKIALDKRLGRSVALTSAYNLLHRNGWRKLAPDKRNPKSDVISQEEWKKNSPNSLPKSSRSGRGKRRSV
jgi:transposase